MPVVRLIKLTRCFGELAAVDNLDLDIATGESFGLLGPNGAGKTTLIKMLTTILPPSSGEAMVAGFSITRAASDVRRVIGYVPQVLSADSSLTGYENLSIFAGLYSVPARTRRERTMEALRFMGLEEAAHRLVRTYSGGMIRRLEIAQSILHHPSVLFLDEPTVGLDPIARKAVWEVIAELRRSYGTTLLTTTHFMEEADSLCSRVAIMHHGVVVALGSPATLKATVGPNATMEDVFIHYTGDNLTEAEGYHDTARTRRVASRLG
ncbi:MAG: ATP-binding cassette domain-containing protein [Dehalococcoidia bacterium]|nr:ATP-binding cassette domain-containing protein [Dehalococcoidia bacterium]